MTRRGTVTFLTVWVLLLVVYSWWLVRRRNAAALRESIAAENVLHEPHGSVPIPATQANRQSEELEKAAERQRQESAEVRNREKQEAIMNWPTFLVVLNLPRGAECSQLSTRNLVDGSLSSGCLAKVYSPRPDARVCYRNYSRNLVISEGFESCAEMQLLPETDVPLTRVALTIQRSFYGLECQVDGNSLSMLDESGEQFFLMPGQHQSSCLMQGGSFTDHASGSIVSGTTDKPVGVNFTIPARLRSPKTIFFSYDRGMVSASVRDDAPN